MEEQLRLAINAWKEADAATRTGTQALQQLRATRDEMQMDVIAALEQAGHGTSAVIKFSNAKLRISEAKQTSPLTLACVKASLQRCIEDETTIDAIMNVIREDRVVKTRTVIRYTPEI